MRVPGPASFLEPKHMSRSDHETIRETVLNDTRRWLERAVIGLNLCPFAKSVYVKGQVHLAVSAAVDATSLLLDLIGELQALNAAEPQARDTTVLIAPYCMHDFLDFNDFLSEADDALRALQLEGTLQIASFHPQYQFAGTTPDDITNFTNRAPYPTLHLLREASIDRAVAAFPDAEAIFEANMTTLQRLGHAGWNTLDLGPGVSRDESPGSTA